MELSVVIPTYNRLSQLQTVLDALTAQTLAYDRFEVIVVSDGSSDGTLEYLHSAAFPFPLLAISQANAGPAAARNNGVQQAQGEVVVFLDDDVVPAPTLLAEHTRTHKQFGPQTVVIGPLVTPSDFAMQLWVRWEQDRLEEQYCDMLAGRWEATARQFYTGNASVRKEAILTAGGFDPHFRRAEDVELGYRLAEGGFRFVFNHHAIGYHYAERSFHSWLTTAYQYGRNDVIFTLDRRQHWLLPLVEREFQTRNPLVRWLVHICLNRTATQTLVVQGLRGVAWLCVQAHWRRGAYTAFSLLFNLRYYQGVADEIKTRDERCQSRHTMSQLIRYATLE